MFESLDAATKRDDEAPHDGRACVAEAKTPGGRRGDVRRALWVALAVGSLLNLINQGEAIFAEGEFNWVKAALTYVVPFFVSLHGAAQARRP
ncbi:MAG TPA: hypothetical protein DHW63_12925 [Hyphomonadaceae bacterium]|nr:hypothetical protein [Hyphomonadaceae bacterium]